MADHDSRDRYQRRLSALKVERTPFDDHYKSVAQFISPKRGRFLGEDKFARGGHSDWNQIINSQATWALRVATAGIFNGIMSPSRPWLMLETDDPDVVEFGPAKTWFYTVQEQMRRVFNASNLYNMAPMMIRELLLFAAGCMSHEDDSQELARFYTHTVGSYYLAQSDRFVVDTVAREFEMTVAQIMSKFAKAENGSVSATVRNQYALGNYDTTYPVCHFVEPNPDFVPGSVRPTQRAFTSVYFEPGNSDKDVFLSRRGFDEFPFYCPRWDTTNEDTYGTDCPAMTALGDVKQLQLQEKRKAQAIDKMVSPPLHGPAVLRNQMVSSLPSGGTFYDAPGQSNSLKPIYEVNLRLQELGEDMRRVEDRINRAFFVDLFLAISAMEGVQPRNQLELMQRNQERLLQLGPTLERLFGEFLDPLVSRTFNQMIRAGILPPPPDVLQGRVLKPRYISTLAMAQQAVSTGNIDRLVTFASGLVAGGWPGAADKVDADQAVDEYAALIGAPARIVVPDEVVAQRRQQRAEQETAAANMAASQQMAGMAKMAGDTKLGGDTLAGRLMEKVGQ